MKYIAALAALALSPALHAQTPIPAATPSRLPKGLIGSALDQPASGGTNDVINGIQILKAMWTVQGHQPQQVASKVKRFIRNSNASSSNPVKVVVTEDFAQIKTGTEATFRGTAVTNGNLTTSIITKDARPVLSIVYLVDGVQKMVSAPQGSTIVFP